MDKLERKEGQPEGEEAQLERGEALTVAGEISDATRSEVISSGDGSPSEQGSPEEHETSALFRYKVQYAQLPGDIRNRCSWEELSNRLVAKESHYLELAKAMQDGGELVYIDDKGNPIFKDGGVEPVMQRMSYNETREVLYGKDYEEGTPHHGYEMPNPDREEELRAIELITGRPFVASDNGREHRATHMESGKNPEGARRAGFFPNSNETKVHIYGGRHPNLKRPGLGMMRLLRVREMT